ncbi:phage tail protein [Nocardioides sp. TF02-7]|uniref:phage tail protein n=1 Tax=Nocardioides sp. TF02-7 TaxID=2917724 RepID=UPI001F06E8CA|nr:phage tail protein [Nocardioides sp. TF02-7]UMG94809.1 phage tail protein [Nocardioides sp. TF02-7]
MTSPQLVARVSDARARPRRSPTWMVDQLPVSMSSEDFFVRFVSIFQDVGTTLLEDADLIEHLPDLGVAPPETVRWLGSWIGLGSLDHSLPETLQRRIVASAAQTLAWRGTAHGLRTFLRLVTGGEVHLEEGGGVWRDGEAPADTAWVRVTVADAGLLSEPELVEVVRDEVPAHVRSELYLGDRLLWTSDRSDRTDRTDGDVR